MKKMKKFSILFSFMFVLFASIYLDNTVAKAADNGDAITAFEDDQHVKDFKAANPYWLEVYNDGQQSSLLIIGTDNATAFFYQKGNAVALYDGAADISFNYMTTNWTIQTATSKTELIYGLANGNVSLYSDMAKTSTVPLFKDAVPIPNPPYEADYPYWFIEKNAQYGLIKVCYSDTINKIDGSGRLAYDYSIELNGTSWTGSRFEADTTVDYYIASSNFDIYTSTDTLFLAKLPTQITNNEVAVNVGVEPAVDVVISNVSIDFGTVNPNDGFVEIVSAFTVTVKSNVSYSLMIKPSGDFKNGDGTKTIAISNLNYKLSTSGSYIPMDITSDTLDFNAPFTAGKSYTIDLKLNLDWSMYPDNYSTVLKITVVQ